MFNYSIYNLSIMTDLPIWFLYLCKVFFFYFLESIFKGFSKVIVDF